MFKSNSKDLDVLARVIAPIPIVLGGWALIAISAPAFSSQISKNTGESILLYPSGALPEPFERLVFILFAALVPIAAVVYMRFVSSSQLLKPVRINYLISSILSLSLCALLLESEFVSVFLNAFASNYVRAIFLACLLPAALLLLFLDPFLARLMTYAPVAIMACIAAFFIQILPTRLASIDTVSDVIPAWHVHLDAVLYPLSQVVAGKTLLADLPSQYGLFPEIIAPLFSVIPLNIFTFTVLFAFFQFAALTCLFLLLQRNIDDRFLAFCSSLALLMPTSLFMSGGYWMDLYIQYYPVRFFFPALSLFLLNWYVLRPNTLRLCALSLALGLAILWNLDAGIVSFLSVAFTLLVRWIFLARDPVDNAHFFSQFLSLVVGALSVVALFILYLYLKAGRQFSIAEWFIYQKTFYGLGFAMLPLPLHPHPWQLALLVYCAGIFFALRSYRLDINLGVRDLALTASLLGIGLFSYYQGRSHINCFVFVLWPAIIVGTLLVDSLFRKVRTDNARLGLLPFALPLFVFNILSATTAAASLSMLYPEGRLNILRTGIQSNEIVANELNFIRSTIRGRQCLILAKRQAIYHAETRTSSPLNGPGLIEMLLREDYKEFSSDIRNGLPQCIYLGRTRSSEPPVPVPGLLDMYYVDRVNSLGTMMLLLPRPDRQS